MSQISNKFGINAFRSAAGEGGNLSLSPTGVSRGLFVGIKSALNIGGQRGENARLVEAFAKAIATNPAYANVMDSADSLLGKIPLGKPLSARTVRNILHTLDMYSSSSNKDVTMARCIMAEPEAEAHLENLCSQHGLSETSFSPKEREALLSNTFGALINESGDFECALGQEDILTAIRERLDNAVQQRVNTLENSVTNPSIKTIPV